MQVCKTLDQSTQYTQHGVNLLNEQADKDQGIGSLSFSWICSLGDLRNILNAISAVAADIFYHSS
jgi:hypothetical protein